MCCRYHHQWRERAGYFVPQDFMANIGEQCTTVPNTVLEFPNPGAVVERSEEGAMKPEGAGCV